MRPAHLALSIAASAANGRPPPSSRSNISGAKSDGSTGRSAYFARPAELDSLLEAQALPHVRTFDFLVIGSGIAGLTYALAVARYGSVAIVTKADAGEGCTRYAQGGICAVLDGLDSVASHVEDTLVAGAFLNDPK
jgi:hypothetical protein